MTNDITRRGFFATGASVLGTAAGVTACAPAGDAAAAGGRTRLLRVAHFTDTHVQPEADATAGMARALHHLQEQGDPPTLILAGGDNIMDAFGADRARTEAQWQVWLDVLKNENSLPLITTIGNHDVWMQEETAPPTGMDPLHGKRSTLEKLGLDSRFFSHEQSGWKFISLDSVFTPPDGGYVGRLDEEQFDWLTTELQGTPAETHVCVLSHIPILSASTFFDGDNEATGNWQVPGSWMHLDARRIKNLFLEHPNVKVALSGHIHLVDQVDYLGVRYLCDGAVSGGWWNGNYQEFPPAYVLVDLYDDGSAEGTFVPWQVEAGVG